MRWSVSLAMLSVVAVWASPQLTSAQTPRRQRVEWTVSQIVGTPDPPAPYRLEQIFPQVSFENPVDMTMLPGTDTWVVLELGGRVYSFPNRADAKPELVVDLKQHLPKLDRAYGITFPPDVSKTRECYISYVEKAGLPNGSHVSRFPVRQLEPLRVDASAEEEIISWLSGGHNGACLKFGPDGMLYVSTGDGGPAFPPDPLRSGQDISNLLSAILRIDVSQGEQGRKYRIPADNPFVSRPGARGEIWCYGHRNPWKMSFDSLTGDLWIGDVGWEMWELVFRAQRGGNYGWSIMEGSQRVHYDRAPGPTEILAPTVEHSHIESRSVTGGFVYRGQRLPKLNGAYLYGDYVTGNFWSARPAEKSQAVVQDEPRQTNESVLRQAAPGVEVREIARSSVQVITFAEDRAGELYIVGYGGKIYRLVENDAETERRPFPQRLSETGLFADVPSFQPAAGVLAYQLRVEPWADGTLAERHLAVPGAGVLEQHETQNPQVGQIRGQWKFPVNTVLMKTVSIETRAGDPASRRRLETQLLHLHEDQTWRPYTYVWNESQTDAALAPQEGSYLELSVEDPRFPGSKQTRRHRISSRSECIMCHTARGGVVYGFRPEQLDCPHLENNVNQLQLFDELGMLAQPVRSHTRFAAPHDQSASLEVRARSYLDVNCAHCHRRGGGGTAALELIESLELSRTHLTEAPTQGAFNLLDARVVAPGDPYRSVLYYRMAKLGKGHMPQFGAEQTDPAGLRMIGQWIRSLTPAESEDDTVAKLRRRQSEQLNRWMKDDDVSTAQLALASLLETTSGALQVQERLEHETELPEERRRQAIVQGAASEDPRVRDLFEAYLPPSERTRRLGAVIDVEELLTRAGDMERGEALFSRAAGVQCRNCHRIGAQGKPLGPDLTAIGKQLDRRQLLQSILDPSAKIDPKFLAWTALTEDGEIHTGLITQRDERQVVLITAAGKSITIPTAEIARLAPQQKSLMPDLLLSEMTEQQVADLLAYLSSLK
ncbi:MAG: PQQ-dependent sugar dehydrogenase [Planctomycetales bacterium]|nr:PQQ-dependent sugar dehydrogenase [Planctomycetales bacterium]